MPDRDPMPLLQGTLDMLILRTLILGPRHGHGIAVTIQRSSDDDLLVDHGSLYPALQRLERQRLIKSKWGVSDLNRRARFYELTAAGRRQLAAETGKWDRMVRAIGRIMQRPQEEET
jgi:transcriptional regulator